MHNSQKILHWYYKRSELICRYLYTSSICIMCVCVCVCVCDLHTPNMTQTESLQCTDVHNTSHVHTHTHRPDAMFFPVHSHSCTHMHAHGMHSCKHISHSLSSPFTKVHMEIYYLCCIWTLWPQLIQLARQMNCTIFIHRICTYIWCSGGSWASLQLVLY